MDQIGISSVVIELVEGYPRLAGQIYQRRSEESERNDKKHSYAALVLDTEKRAHESNHHQQRCDDRADRCVQYCSVQKSRALLQSRKIAFEVGPRRLGIANAVQ